MVGTLDYRINEHDRLFSFFPVYIPMCAFLIICNKKISTKTISRNPSTLEFVKSIYSLYEKNLYSNCFPNIKTSSNPPHECLFWPIRSLFQAWSWSVSNYLDLCVYSEVGGQRWYKKRAESCKFNWAKKV